MFSGVGINLMFFLWESMPNLQCERDLPNHNHLPSITINGTKRTRKLLRVTIY